MDERWRIYLLAVTVVACTSNTVRSLEFSIGTTWNSGALDHAPVNISLSASPDQQYLLFNVSAPFFNDPPGSPPGPPGQSFIGLWEYEVVHGFFLNDDDQYMEVEVCPWGQHLVFLLNGQRVTVRHSLQMEFTAQRGDGTWTGSAAIPVTYLPKNVTKFNAHAVHGSGFERVYESLYPAPSTAAHPDFHALQYFQPIDLSSLLPTQASEPMSQLWSDALHGLFRYDIATTWDSRPLSAPLVQISLQGFEAGVEMNVTAPFYNDPAPSGNAGEPFYGLWDYEVVEMFFLNKNDEYLEVELGPWGQHLLLLLQGERNAIKHSLPLDYIVTERIDPVGGAPGQWKGSAMIPPEYFPPNVTLMNIYAIHGLDDARQYQALYPAPKDSTEYPNPDFHRLDLFRAIDFELQVKNNNDYSQVWQDAMESSASTLSVTEEMLTTTLGPLRPAQTIEPVTQQPTNPDAPEVNDATFLPEATNTESPGPTNTFTPKPTNTFTPEPTETVPTDNTDITEAVSQDPTTLPPTTPAPTTLPEPLDSSTLTLSPGNTRTAVRRRPHPQRVNTNKHPGNLVNPSLPVRPRRRPVPTPLRMRPNRRVASQRTPPQQGFPFDINLGPDEEFIQHILSQQHLGFQAPEFSPRDHQSRGSVGHQFQPPRGGEFQPPRGEFQPPRGEFQPPRGQPFQPPRGEFQPPNGEFQPPRGEFQPPRGQPFQSPPGGEFQSPPSDEFQPPPGDEFQPPRGEQFKPPRGDEFHPSRGDEFQPPRGEHFKPPREFLPPRGQPFQPSLEEEFQPPLEEEFKPPRDEQFQPPLDEQFQPPLDEHFQPPRDGFQVPREEELQPPRDEQFQPPRDEQFQPPREEEIQLPREELLQPPPRAGQPLPPRDQQFSGSPQEQQQEQPRRRPSSGGEQEPASSRKGDAPLGVGEEDVGLQQMEKVLASLTEDGPALPPPHPICFNPGLVPDEHRCWVFHECELKDGQWQVYSWKCIRGHIYDPFNVACVPGRCRRRG